MGRVDSSKMVPLKPREVPRMSKIIPVILSGGSGSRLWPLSRALRPKQFLALTGDQTLFQMSLQRLTSLVDPLRPIIVANDDHRFLVADQCLQIGVTPKALLLEPVARNTAPAIAVAALAAQDADQDPVLLVLPSDHVFSNVAAVEAAVRGGELAAHNGALVTFGIVPTAPETGYGYVKASGSAVDGLASPCVGLYTVEAFVEKPDLHTAKQYVAEGNYFWNSGMFMFKASVFLAELGRFNPAMLAACQRAISTAKRDLDFVRLDTDAFGASPSDSIDYAVMEKTDKAVLLPLDAGWSDVGAWSSVWQVQPQDDYGNGVRGDVLLHQSTDCYVHADYRMVSLVGVNDLVVVETSDAVLVVHKDKAQDVKMVVEELKARGRSEADLHREVFRPWGSYDLIDRGERYQVKRISVKPGARLSLQVHNHRAEHWVVVKGTARITIGDEIKLVSENQSVYIPVGVRHCLENPGAATIELVEIQSGNYLGEDDIVRFDDKYGRA